MRGNPHGGEFQLRPGIIPGKARGDTVVLQSLLRARENVHVPEYSRQAYFVLVLEIGAVAPFQHCGGDTVVPLFQKRRDVELLHAVGHLGITHEFPVDIEIHAAVHALEHENTAHFVRHMGIIPAVHAHRDIVRDVGRIKRNGITHVGILRHVESMQLPV